MDGKGRWAPKRVLPLAALAAVVVSGCMGLPAQLMYVIYGHKVAAEYEGLTGKKVAVVCVSDASAYGPNTLTYTVERKVGERLAANVSKIQVVPQATVDNWKDQFGWDESDFVQIGRGIGADSVVAIEIGSYSLHEGATILKGQVTVKTTVYNVKDQAIEFQNGPEDYQFPKSGRLALQITERQFETAFLEKLCEHLARRFYEYEVTDRIAEDAGM